MKRYIHCTIKIIRIDNKDVFTDSTETSKLGEYEKIITDVWADY